MNHLSSVDKNTLLNIVTNYIFSSMKMHARNSCGRLVFFLVSSINLFFLFLFYKFSQPEKYWNVRLPNKLPPPKTPIDLFNLPSLGYLEQTVATAITKSLTATGCFKPKFPFLSIQSSALIYLAYHLKAYNSKSSDYLRRKFRRKLYFFEEQCELISYLAEKTPIRYKEIDKRTPDYNIKYETFFALQQNTPTLNWLT